MGAGTIVVTSKSKATFWHKLCCPASFVTASRCRVWDPITVVYRLLCRRSKRVEQEYIMAGSCNK